MKQLDIIFDPEDGGDVGWLFFNRLRGILLVPQEIELFNTLFN
jgi:hypothetical protein